MTFYANSTDSDLTPSWAYTTSFNKELSLIPQGSSATVKSITISASGFMSGGYITPLGQPNSNPWEDGGTWTLEYKVSTASMYIRSRVRAVALNNTGTILQSGTFSSYSTMSPVELKSFSITAPTWTFSESCDNRLAIEWEFENINTMSSENTIITFYEAVSLSDYETITTLIPNNPAFCGWKPQVMIY